MKNEKDYVADIMKQWYDVMQQNKVMVQPKASTLLGTILAGYKIEPKTPDRDVWAEAMSLRGGDFMAWYNKLSTEHQEIYHTKLQPLQDNKRDKSLLKG